MAFRQKRKPAAEPEPEPTLPSAEMIEEPPAARGEPTEFSDTYTSSVARVDPPANPLPPIPPAPEIVARYELGPERLASAALAVLGDDDGHRMALRQFALCVVVDAEGHVGLGVSRNANINASDARKAAYAAAVADIALTS